LDSKLDYGTLKHAGLSNSPTEIRSLSRNREQSITHAAKHIEVLFSLGANGTLYLRVNVWSQRKSPINIVKPWLKCVAPYAL